MKYLLLIVSLIISSLTFGQMSFQTDFESGLDFPTTVGHLTRTTELSRTGSYSVKVEVIKGDPMIAQGARSEMNLNPIASIPAEQWFGMSYYIPTTWTNDADKLTDILAQWHSASGQPPIAFGINVNQWYCQFAITNGGIIPLGTVTKGAWTDVVFHMLWNSTTSGLCEIWINGVKVETYNNATFPAETPGPFFKCGDYKWPWNTGSGELNGVGSLTSDRLLYIDAIKVWTGTGGSQAAVSPDGTGGSGGGTTPVANAGPDQTINLPNSASLSGQSSTGSIVSYSWSKVTGPGSVTFSLQSGSITSASFSAQGTYVLRLTINGTVIDDVTITVNPHTVPAVTLANATVNLPGTYTGNPVITYYQSAIIGTSSWSQVSGPGTAVISNKAIQNAMFTFPAPGSYVLKYVVTDTYGGKDSATATITVVSSAVPVSNAGSNKTINAPSTTAFLDGSLSSGSGLSYTWSFTSGPVTPTIAHIHTDTTTVTGLTAPGSYLFLLKVTSGSDSSKSPVSITVTNDGCQCFDDFSGIYPAHGPYVDVTELDTVGGRCSKPSVVTNGNPTITLPASSVQLGVKATSTNGSSLSYSWIQLSGGPSGLIVNGNTASPTISGFKAAGTATFQVTVTDGCAPSLFTTNTVIVTVNAAPVVTPTVTIQKVTPIYRTIWWFFRQLTGITITYSNGKTATVNASSYTFKNGVLIVNGKPYPATK